MTIVRCNCCECVSLETELIPYEELDCCPACSNSECLMNLDGTEEYYSQEQIKKLWSIFGDIPMNPDMEEMEDEFLCFSAGTHREDIWHWFDDRYSGGVVKLMFGESI